MLHYLKKFDYLFLTIAIYSLSIGLFYIPMGIFLREISFKTFNESSPCTSDETLTCTANIFWTCIRCSFLGPVGYMLFSFLFHKVSSKMMIVGIFLIKSYLLVATSHDNFKEYMTESRHMRIGTYTK